MPGIDRTLADEILKEVYGDSVSDQLNSETRILNRFEKTKTARWTGRQFIEALRIGRNHGSKAAAESGLLPVAGRQDYDNLQIPMKRCYGTIQVTGPFMAEVRDEGAFVDGVAAEIEGLVKDMQEDAERMMWGFGQGTLALVNEDNTGGNTTFAVDAPGGVAGAVNGARFIAPGMVCAFHVAAPTNNTPLVVRTITAVSADGLDITVDATVDETEAPINGKITRGVTRNGTLEGSWELEPMGLIGMIDDGTFVSTFHGLDRTAVPIFKSNVFASVGNLDEIIFHRGFDFADEDAGVSPDWLMCHHSVHRSYISQLLPDRRFSGDQANRPDGGIVGGGVKKELTWSDSPIEKHRYAPYGSFYAVDSSVCKRYASEEGKWIDEDGAILRKVDGKDDFEAHYRRFVNFSVMQSNSSFVLKGINATVDAVNRN